MSEAKRKTPPDWTRTGTVGGYAEYLRKASDAICVLVIRPHDSVFAVDPRCAPVDAERLVKEYVPHLAGRVEQARLEKRAARLRSGDGDLSPLE
jgi:cysteine synthase